MSADKPWALVCVKGDRIGGVISPDLPPKEVGEFIADFVAQGYAIHTVFNRAEYDALYAGKHFGPAETTDQAKLL